MGFLTQSMLNLPSSLQLPLTPVPGIGWLDPMTSFGLCELQAHTCKYSRVKWQGAPAMQANTQVERLTAHGAVPMESMKKSSTARLQLGARMFVDFQNLTTWLQNIFFHRHYWQQTLFVLNFSQSVTFILISWFTQEQHWHHPSIMSIEMPLITILMW